MTFLFCPLPDLPRVPVDYLTRALDKDRENKLSRFGYAKDTFDPAYANRSVIKDGKKYTSRFQYKYDLGEDFFQWCKSNIHQDSYHCGVSYNQGPDPFHGPHVDLSRHYVLFYLLDPGGPNVTTSWWHKPDMPVELDEDKYGKFSCDYDELILLDQISIPTHTWILFNARVIHSIENVVEERISLQCSLAKTVDLTDLINIHHARYSQISG